MKRICSLIVTLALICGLAAIAAATDVSLRSDRATVEPGDTLVVTVTLEEPIDVSEGATMLQGALTYDGTLLEFQSLKKNPALSDAAKHQSEDRVLFHYLSISGEPVGFGAGELVTIRFTILEAISAETAEASVNFSIFAQNALGQDVAELTYDSDLSVMVCPGHSYKDGICIHCGVEDPDYTAPEIASGWSGYTQWTLTGDGVLTFRGEGNMRNYDYDRNQPWLQYADQITAVVVEEGVTAVGSGAFMDLVKLETVTLPESGLTKIGEAAFYNCSGLKEIRIPDTIYTVWGYTFKGCTSLTEVRLPKSLIKIDEGAFENCTGLDYVFIPGNTEIIGSWSFKGCTGLVEADMQWTDATEIREGAFKNCNGLTKIVLPENIQILGDSCFYGIGAKSFVVPETITAVGPWCFARASVTEIVFEGDAPTIGEGAFNKITLKAFYPGDNATWTADVMKNYGGTITWSATEME